MIQTVEVTSETEVLCVAESCLCVKVVKKLGRSCPSAFHICCKAQELRQEVALRQRDLTLASFVLLFFLITADAPESKSSASMSSSSPRWNRRWIANRGLFFLCVTRTTAKDHIAIAINHTTLIHAVQRAGKSLRNRWACAEHFGL